MTRAKLPRETIRKRVLPNGLTLLTERVEGVRSASLGFWVSAGSRDETPRELGLSHFMEHMIFKGTSRRSARAIAEEMDAVGGSIDAFTSSEQTCFYSQVLAENVPLAVDLLADIVLDSTFSPEEIDKERQVIIEEIKMVEDDPEDSVHEAAMVSVWGDHPLGKPILGTEETISRFTREDFLAYLDRHYRGAGLTFAAAGAVDPDQLEALLMQAFAAIPARGEVAARTVPGFLGGTTVVSRKSQQVHLILAFPAIPYDHPDRYGLFVANAILGGTMSSRLFQEVREELGLVYNIYSTPVLYADAGAVIVYAAVGPENLAKVLEVVDKELATLAGTAPTDQEMEKAKGHLKGTTALGMEKTSTRMMTLAKQELYCGRSFTLEEVLASIDAVTPEDVLRLSSSIFVPGSGNLTLLGPVEAGKAAGLTVYVPDAAPRAL